MLAQTLILAAEEEGGGSSGLDLLLPATPELIAGIIAFAIVFFFVWKWAVPALNRSLEERQKAIGGQIKEAEAAKAEAESLLNDYKAQLAELKAGQAEAIEAARSEGEAMKADILAKANAEAESIVSKAREDAAAEKGRVLADARSEVANLSIDLAERVVAQSLDRETQLGLVERYIAELEK
ncbi:MAG: F0F1 ATP synthase subunit B [Acidimicrobiia bacterium]|nr:F0F1 ATP synthase subunit B [Acidimicrobiia bacterium]MDH4307058.1 F0F1 ATP synthase subunit B [Acidimicrobiia bacterium]MDH5294016.1 F0F1 ATP synthase subunit B [Acidimicrobiia bacterium]